ncbi:MAG: PHP domain-containing protein [Erysipelotrichaceae bacterium]|nr:PHP domain-containing protein [Erysipelotrichaceae bacterium]
MEKHVDLHSHSVFSDGTLTPDELVRLAERQGISVLALTDHNTSAGLKEFMEAGKKSDVITVPGCEFSTEWRGKEVHIVGLFFNEKYWNEIEDFVELMHVAKHNSNLILIKNLNKAGYELTYEEAAALTDAEEFNRTHVARVLMNKGYVSSVNQAFEELLTEGKGFYYPAQKITSIAAIRFIKVYGAAAIMAHPLLNLTYQEMMEFLPEAKKAGLDAIETRYTEFDEEMTQTAVSLAEHFELKQSGGSDFHGTTKPGIQLGSGRGGLFVPYRFYEELLDCAKLYNENKES